jgi:hypothetical protein
MTLVDLVWIAVFTVVGLVVALGPVIGRRF